MFTVLMALAMAVLDKPTKRAESHEAPIPLMWDEFGNARQPEVVVVNLKPTWKIGQVTSANNDSLSQSNESNLEQLHNQMETVKIEDLAPKLAIQNNNKEHSGPQYRIRYGMKIETAKSNYHCPWHLAIQSSWPGYSYVAKILQYDLVKSPTIEKPYYEAFVCSMPNIRCKAKTIEALQEQLLHQYSEYLAKMLQDEEDFPNNHHDIRRPTRTLGLPAEGQKAPAITDPGYLDLIFPYGIHDYSH